MSIDFEENNSAYRLGLSLKRVIPVPFVAALLPSNIPNVNVAWNYSNELSATSSLTLDASIW